MKLIDQYPDVEKDVRDAFRWPMRLCWAVGIVCLLVAACMALQGCSTKTYTSPEGAKITSTTFIYGPELTGLRAVDGNRTLEIEGQKTDIQQALTIIDKLTAPAKLGAAVMGVPAP